MAAFQLEMMIKRLILIENKFMTRATDFERGTSKYTKDRKAAGLRYEWRNTGRTVDLQTGSHGAVRLRRMRCFSAIAVRKHPV
jgi:hypothetical protein